MPRYERLSIDIDAEPWALDGVAPELAHDLGATPLAEPLRLPVSGASPASLIPLPTGRGLDATTDVIVSDELARVLAGVALPRHAVVACLAEPGGFDLRTMRKRRKQPPRPFRWLRWAETFARRVDLARSTFFLRYPDGARAEATYESHDDWLQVRRRAAESLAFDLAPATLEWADDAVYALDLVPLGPDLFLSPRLAELLRAAALPGLRVLPARETATVLA
jgi:hypothetical protein